MLKIWQKLSFSKKFNPFTSLFIVKKQALQCLMSFFVIFLLNGLISN